MDRPTRLNERAAAAHRASLWHVDDGWSLFAGPLDRNAPHAHSAAVYLAGLYGTFRLRVRNEAWRTCRAAVVRAGTPYEFDAHGAPLGVFYLEPSAGRAEALAPLMHDSDEVGGALVGNGHTASIRRLFEERPPSDDMRAAAADLLCFSRRHARRHLDSRIARAVEAMQITEAGEANIASIASSAGLSASRFQHLFSEQVGVPFRRYRVWQRLRSAIRIAAAGALLTEAAHAAGFADQAHFSRAFRATFGAPPSRGL
jgi:AraC-like DNA-binding protein